jgi:transketolase
MINYSEKCREIRRLIVDSIGHLGVGHIGGCLSSVELLTVLYFDKMDVDPNDPKKEGRDRLIVSKGHAGPAVYAALACKGYFPVEKLYTLNEFGTDLPSHCDMNRTPGVDMTAGSLGQGFSCAVGIAIGSNLSGDGATIYALIGDGESQEGQIWEAAMLAAHKKLGNLIAFTDNNKLQIDGYVDEVNSLGDIEAKWRAFGWHVQRIDGHDCLAISAAIDLAKMERTRPSMIILDTIKGKGVSFVEQAGMGNHNMTLTPEQVKIALAELQ